MGRNVQVLRTLFSDMFRKNKSPITEFLSIDDVLNLTDTFEITELKKEYLTLFNMSKDVLHRAGKVEELIIQLRCRELIRDTIKLSFVRDYIYARSIFYQSKKDVKDIRVVICKLEDAPEKYPDHLYANKEFITLAVEKLQTAMDVIIEKNKKELYGYDHILRPT